MVNDLADMADQGATVDRTFAGLADPTRRAIVDLLAGGPRSFGDVASRFGVSKPAVSRHLRLLRQAGLVHEERIASDGRVRIYSLREEPLDQLDRWVEQSRRFWQERLDAFRRVAGEEAARERAARAGRTVPPGSEG